MEDKYGTHHNYLYERIAKNAVIFTDLLMFLTGYVFFRHSFNAEIILPKLNSNGSILGYTYTGIDWFFIAAAICIAFLRYRGVYSQRQIFWIETRITTKALLTVSLFDLVAIFTIYSEDTNKTCVLLSWAFLIICIPIARIIMKLFLKMADIWDIPTIIIGTGETAKNAYETLSKETLLGFDVKLFIEIGTHKKGAPKSFTFDDGAKIPIAKLPKNHEKFFKSLGTPHVIIALEENQDNKTIEIIEHLTIRPNTVDIIPPISKIAMHGLDVHPIFGQDMMLLRTRNNLARLAPKILKRLFDLTLTTTALILLSPFFIVVSYFIRKDRGPTFYKHTRIGKDGKLFECYKFRSMVNNSQEVFEKLLAEDVDAKKEWETTYKLKNDPRITKFGNILRKTSLDELPQLFNVFKGEMSLVGPRPITEEELNTYGDHIQYYLQVSPGITGLWQISGRNEVSYQTRVTLDVWYLKNWSIWYDLVILLKTVVVVLSRKGAY
ncbi:MAG: undecaprenyl-phosphate galactose phosphotransferase WbaP [Alphaproteobacteria bacterium]|nr:undecaprenyl-phosphate galactose phosphotransferase WbaP [Alphaproteobacteria bacterium]